MGLIISYNILMAKEALNQISEVKEVRPTITVSKEALPRHGSVGEFGSGRFGSARFGTRSNTFAKEALPSKISTA